MINKSTTSSITKTTVTHQLNGKDVIDLLKIPANASRVTVQFDIPGGGDWSNTRYDFLTEDRIIVTYEVETDN